MAIDAVSRVAHDDAGAREVVGSCGSSVGRTTGCGLRHRVSPSGLFAAAKEMSSTGTGEQQQSNEDGGWPGTDGRRRSANRGSEGGSQASTAPTSDKVRSAGAPMETASEAALQKLPRAGPEDWRRWAACRAQYSRSPTEGRGSAPGSHIALRREGCATVVCSRAGCDALVHLHSARRRARREGRDSFAVGDGCAGRGCSINFRPGQFKKAQRRMAAALVAGERFLAPWPNSCDDGDLHYFPAAVAEAAAAAALASLSPALERA